MAFKPYKIAEACQYLNKDYPIRRSGDELKKLLEKKDFKRSDLEEKLGSGNVNNWLREDKNKKEISRDMAMKILLVLKVDDLTEAEDFIMHSCGHDGFYARSYEDVIYIFCLKNSNGEKEISIEKMDDLIEKYKYLEKLNPNIEEISSEYQNNKRVTQILFDKVEELKNEKDLEKFFVDYKNFFGNLNRTAHNIFLEFYNKDKTAQEFLPDENKKDVLASTISLQKIVYSVNKIAKTFENRKSIKEDYIPNKTKLQRSTLNLLQKIISKEALITRSTLTKVINKEENVPRKYLILFFLKYCGGDKHETLIDQLNSSLYECGMPLLDSRNPFDWIVMNSLYYSDISDDSAIDRLKEVAKAVFKI